MDNQDGLPPFGGAISSFWEIFDSNLLLKKFLSEQYPKTFVGLVCLLNF
jgi:hypothetical protein